MLLGKLLIVGSLLLCFQSNNLWAVPNIRIPDLALVQVFASTESDPTMTVFHDLPASGVGDTSGSPLVVYIPLDGNDDQINNTLFGNPSVLPKKIGAGTTTFKIVLRLTNDSVDQTILNIGVKENTENQFQPFPLLNSLASRTVPANTVIDVIVSFTLDSMCTEADCADIQSTIDDRDETFELHFFFDSINQTNTHTGTQNGFYLRLRMSDRVPQGNFELVNLIKGDERLTGQIINGDQITQMGNDLYRLYVHRYPEAIITEQISRSVGTAAGSQQGELLAAQLSGNVTVKNLVNGVDHNLAFALMNKYQFVSKLSNSKVASAEDILGLLEAQACFLLSAGFQKEHIVLEIFRGIRDSILMQFDWGKLFVNSYYRYAPPIAGMIYQDPVLAALVRFGAVLFLVLLAAPFFFLLRYCWTSRIQLNHRD